MQSQMTSRKNAKVTTGILHIALHKDRVFVSVNVQRERETERERVCVLGQSEEQPTNHSWLDNIINCQQIAMDAEL